MEVVLVAMILLIVGGIALGMYMDWFGLWVSKNDMNKEMERLTRKRLQDLGTLIGVAQPEASAETPEASGTAAGTRN